MAIKQKHIAFGAFTPVYYRWEVCEVLPVLYPAPVATGEEEEQEMEPNVGQIEDGLLPEDAQVWDPVWSLYGRRKDNFLADHIADRANLKDMLTLVRSLGASSSYVLPAPLQHCHGRWVQYENDNFNKEWGDLDWKQQGEKLVTALSIHAGELIEAYGEAWTRSFKDVRNGMPYYNQYLLEEVIRKLQEAV